MKKQNFSKVLLKKFKKCRFAVNLAAAALVFAFTVYTLLPKDEKFDEGEAQKIADAFIKRAEEQSSETQAEPKTAAE